MKLYIKITLNLFKKTNKNQKNWDQNWKMKNIKRDKIEKVFKIYKLFKKNESNLNKLKIKSLLWKFKEASMKINKIRLKKKIHQHQGRWLLTKDITNYPKNIQYACF